MADAKPDFHGLRGCLVAVCLTAALYATHAEGAIVPVGPFTGDFSDTFDRFSSTDAVQSLSVFDDQATLNNLSEGGAIKIEFNSQLNGDLVVPRSGMMVGQLGIGLWDFATPALRFGGYFENNSGADDATLFFYDASDNLIDTVIASVPVAGGTWTWNGWQSDVPFQRIEVVGNGVIDGFIWYEDMQLVAVPEPASGALLFSVLAFTALQGRAKRRTTGTAHSDV